MHLLWQGLVKVSLGTVHAASVLHGAHQPAHSSCIWDGMGHAAAEKSLQTLQGPAAL